MQDLASGRRALIVEGGGLRGAFAVGVLRTLLDQAGPHAFDGIFAVSSGVFAATYFAAGQGDEMEATWRDRVHGRQLIDYRNFVRRVPVLRLDYLIELFRGPVWLDLRRVMESPSALSYILTDYDTGEAAYVDAKRSDIFDLMRASSALPVVYPIPVPIDGRLFYDGGQSDAIPVQHAIDRGFTRLLVIRTRPYSYRKAARSRWIAQLILHSPSARTKWLDLHERYNRSVDLIAQPPPGVDIHSIAPPEGMQLGRLTRSKAVICSGIEIGKAEAQRYIDQHPELALTVATRGSAQLQPS